MRLGLLCFSATRSLLAVVCLAGSSFVCPLQAQDAQQPPPQAEQESEPKTEQAPQPQSPQPQAQESQKHDAQEELEINEHTRTYVVHLPQGYDSQQHYPVVILLHGRDQDAAEMARLTHFNEFADKDSIIAVYPNAANGRWAAGTGQPPPYRRGPYRRRGIYGPGYPPPGQRPDAGERRQGAHGPEDMPFLHRMLDKLATHYSVDTRRIYAVGLGEGGFMALRMGCNMADRVAAIAVVGAAMPKTLNCIPSRPIPVLLINGTDDPIVHYDGGRYKDGLLHLLSAEDSAKEWARLNRCSEKPTESKLPSLQKGGRDTKVYLFDGCRENAQVALYAVKDGGHTWPGGEQYMSEKEVGKTSNALNANETIWSFLVTRKIAGESGVEK
ncbi:MAG TPA: PHB depolymerase family esterase [Candidatus Acidoferrum sp.]|jgi:polyhydroxybutyrate depolymerase|nr:PHB depolymerase family esterase [Candidatus Acidoferrum sp.]